jgi:hypothetical protein
MPLFSGLISCDKNEPKRNETFYCKLNGEAFRPDKDNSPIGGIGSSPLRVQFNKDNGTLFISVRNSPREISLLLLNTGRALKTGSFELLNDSLSSKGSFTPSNNTSPVEDILSNSGQLNISKIDGFNISGTFEFTCKSNKTGKEYRVTEGQFNSISYI